MNRLLCAIACSAWMLVMPRLPAATSVGDADSGRGAFSSMLRAIEQIAVTPPTLTAQERAESRAVLRELRGNIRLLETAISERDVRETKIRELTRLALGLTRIAAKSTFATEDLNTCRGIAKQLAELRRSESPVAGR